MKSLKAHKPFKSEIFENSSFVTDTLLDCIKSNELESFREVLTSHLMTVNKMELAKKAGIGRRTIYDLIDPKKDFNPELSTISALLNAFST
jgi:DNA-binding phage protein